MFACTPPDIAPVRPRAAARHEPHRLAAAVPALPLRLVRDLVRGELNMRAMSLVYTTLLSVVPLVAFSFSLIKGLA